MSNRFLFVATTLLLLHATSAQAQRATITGRVSYQGPELETEWQVADDARQFCGSTTSVKRQVDRGAVQGVVVFLEGMPSVDMNAKPAELRNVNCDFVPAVQVVEAGARLTLINQDPMTHTVQTLRSGLKVSEFTVTGRGGERSDRRLLDGPGLIDVQCRFHKWMRASIWVFDHPYYAVTTADGSFTIPFVVPGTYKLSIWHPQLGVQTREITLAPDQQLPIQFIYRPMVTQ
jgi:plastocyanin